MAGVSTVALGSLSFWTFMLGETVHCRSSCNPFSPRQVQEGRGFMNRRIRLMFMRGPLLCGDARGPSFSCQKSLPWPQAIFAVGTPSSCSSVRRRFAT